MLELNHALVSEKTIQFETGRIDNNRKEIKIPVFEESSYIFTSDFCKYCSTLKDALRDSGSSNNMCLLEEIFPFCSEPSELSNINDINSYGLLIKF